jgi:hypothetical protein
MTIAQPKSIKNRGMIMRKYIRDSSVVCSLAMIGILYGCFSSTKEVDTVSTPSPVVEAVPPPVVQVPAPVVVATSPPAVVAPPPVVVASPASSQTTTSTSWGNGIVQQKKTTRLGDGTVEHQTTTNWNDGSLPTQTTTYSSY